MIEKEEEGEKDEAIARRAANAPAPAPSPRGSGRTWLPAPGSRCGGGQRVRGANGRGTLRRRWFPTHPRPGARQKKRKR